MIVELMPLTTKETDLIKNWKSDKMLSEEILSDFNPPTYEESLNWILKNSSDVNQKLLGIFVKELDLYVCIGVARLMYINNNDKNAELGIYIGNKDYKGKGIGSKALDILTKIGFNELHLNKIYLKVSANNLAAKNLYLKKNFKIEGVLKNHQLLNGKFIDIVLMGLFRIVDNN